jgi:DNA-3-methyladenine glycosylase
MKSVFKPIAREFFSRDPRQVSRDILGKLLVRKNGKNPLVARIVEVEAYLGNDDPAAHAACGRTARNAVLFGPPGHAYVYFIYGNHYCFNISCMPDGDPGCILVRALEPLSGMKEMAALREITLDETKNLKLLTSGPGRLAEAFGITREHDNGKDLTTAKSDLYAADDGYQPDKITITCRIGIRKAAELPLRYIISGNKFVSGRTHVEAGLAPREQAVNPESHCQSVVLSRRRRQPQPMKAR